MSEAASPEADVAALELKLLLDAVHARVGYDFRRYSRASVRRRVELRLEREELGSISLLQHRVLHDRAAMDRLLADLSIQTTEVFRHAPFWTALREHVVPHLRTWPFVTIWSAGCSTGEEVYSLAILLEEAGLYDRSRIYATDMSASALQAAKEGVYPIDRVAPWTKSYQLAGGSEPFNRYYDAAYGRLAFDASLRRNVVFSQHNLTTDAVFQETQLILCRNVMIYFNRSLQDDVFTRFHESLATGGVLCLGSKETLSHTRWARSFEAMCRPQRIYRKQ